MVMFYKHNVGIIYNLFSLIQQFPKKEDKYVGIICTPSCKGKSRNSFLSFLAPRRGKMQIYEHTSLKKMVSDRICGFDSAQHQTSALVKVISEDAHYKW